MLSGGNPAHDLVLPARWHLCERPLAIVGDGPGQFFAGQTGKVIGAASADQTIRQQGPRGLDRPPATGDFCRQQLAENLLELRVSDRIPVLMARGLKCRLISGKSRAIRTSRPRCSTLRPRTWEIPLINLNCLTITLSRSRPGRPSDLATFRNPCWRCNARTLSSANTP